MLIGAIRHIILNSVQTKKPDRYVFPINFSSKKQRLEGRAFGLSDSFRCTVAALLVIILNRFFYLLRATPKRVLSVKHTLTDSTKQDKCF